MEVLTAVLSFALLMIIFSTLVTALTEAWLRLTAERPKVLIRTLYSLMRDDAFFRGYFQKVTSGKIGKAVEWTQAAEKELETIVSILVRNPAIESYEAKIPPPGGFIKGGCSQSLAKLRGKGAGQIDQLTTFAFLQRLAKTELGKEMAKIALSNKDVLGDLLTDISTTFERYVAASNELFRKRAQICTMVLSMLLAFGVNFDAGLIFKYLVNTPEARDALLNAAPKITEDYQTALTRFDALVADQNNSRDEEEGDGNAGPTETGEGRASEKQMADTADNIRKTLTQLTTEFKLPLGYEHSPFWDKEKNAIDWYHPTPPENCEALRKAGAELPRGCRTVPDFLFWFVQVLAGGFLIGLGGPFWYKFYSSMSSAVEMLRALRGQVKSETIQAADGGANPQQMISSRAATALKTSDTEKLVEGFCLAANAEKAALKALQT